MSLLITTASCSLMRLIALLTRERIRLVVMLLALTIGILLISGLWQYTLTEKQITQAGRGVIFILLSLGLMGTRRLSVVLTALLCGSSLPAFVGVDSATQLGHWLELTALILCAGLLLVPARRDDIEDALA